MSKTVLKSYAFRRPQVATGENDLSREEIDKWNARYRSGATGPRIDGPPADILQWIPLLQKGLKALDLGSGLLRNARVLAQRGWDVLAVDGAQESFRQMGRLPENIQGVVADLDDWQPPPASFDLILAVHYLNRGLIPQLVQSLRPGGLLALEIRIDDTAGPGRAPRRYHLAPGEALGLYRGLSCLKAEERGGVARYLFRALEQTSVADV